MVAAAGNNNIGFKTQKSTEVCNVYVLKNVILIFQNNEIF